MSKKPLLISLMLFGLLAAAIWGSFSAPVNAQEGGTTTPTPNDKYDGPKYEEPAKVEGEAEWILNSSNFKSNYPDGFEFTGNASSSAGELASVSIYYSYNGDYEEDIRMRGEVDPATGDLSVTVAGRDADGIPSWVEVNYRWRITDTAGTLYWSDWIVGSEYSDDTHHWTKIESDEVLLIVQDGLTQEAIDETFSAMEYARPLYEQAFGRLLSYKPRVILYSDLETFQEWRAFEYSSGGTYIVGQASPQWGAFIAVLQDDDYEEFAFGIVIHEIAHLYQYDLYEFRGLGWWIEGNASYFEADNFYDYEARVRYWAEQDQLPMMFSDGGPLTTAAGPDNRGRWGYDLGYTFNKWFVETFGWEKHRELVEKLGAPENLPAHETEDFFNETLSEVLGMSLEEIESAWRVWLGAPAAVKTPIPTPTIFMNFPPTPTPFGR